jgi:hypothetical protein
VWNTTQTDVPTNCLIDTNKQDHKENPTLMERKDPNIHRPIPMGAEDHDGPKVVASQHTEVRGKPSP